MTFGTRTPALSSRAGSNSGRSPIIRRRPTTDHGPRIRDDYLRVCHHVFAHSADLTAFKRGARPGGNRPHHWCRAKCLGIRVPSPPPTGEAMELAPRAVIVTIARRQGPRSEIALGPSGFEPESPAPQAGRISCGWAEESFPAPKPSYPTDPFGGLEGLPD